MTKYWQNFLAIILIIEIVNNKNNAFTFVEVTFLCLVERAPFEVSSCFVIKNFYMFVLTLLYAVAYAAEVPFGAERKPAPHLIHDNHLNLRIFCNFLPNHRETLFLGDQLISNHFPS